MTIIPFEQVPQPATLFQDLRYAIRMFRKSPASLLSWPSR